MKMVIFPGFFVCLEGRSLWWDAHISRHHAARAFQAAAAAIIALPESLPG